MGNAEIGIIGNTAQKTCETAEYEWRLADFSSIIQTLDIKAYESPEFFFRSHPWRLRLWVNWRGRENLGLYVKTAQDRDYSIEYSLALKILDGGVKKLTIGTIKADDRASDAFIIKLSSVRYMYTNGKWYTTYEQAPQNTLIIICTLKYEISSCSNPILSSNSTPLKLKGLDKLSEDFKVLFADKESCDTTLKMQDKEYKVHRFVLIARSTVFAATFKYDTLEKQTGIVTIPDCDPDSFQEFLQYLYCGEIEDFSLQSALNLYYTSDKYDVQELKTFCIEYLTRCLTVENMFEVVVFADKNDETKLFSVVQEFFNENACKIFETSRWECFMKTDNRLANKLLKAMSKVKLQK